MLKFGLKGDEPRKQKHSVSVDAEKEQNSFYDAICPETRGTSKILRHHFAVFQAVRMDGGGFLPF